MRKTATFLALATLLLSGVNAALVSRYTFDNSGNLGDDIQNNNEGSLAASPSVTGVNDADRGHVIRFFGGSSGYIHAPTALSGSGFTITTWLKADSWNGNSGVFQVQQIAGSSVDTNGGNKVIGAWVGNTGIAWGRIIESGGATQTMTQAGPSITLGEWTHLAYRGNGSSYEVFINGVAVAASAVAYNGTLNTHANIVIGRQGSETWSGLMDDFRIYDNALSEGEIAALVPEPSTLMLLNTLSLLGLLRRRRN